MKKLYEIVLALTLVLTYLRATVRAIEAPELSNPSNCSCNGINEPRSEPVAFIHCSKHNKSYINSKYVRPVDTSIRPVYIKDGFSLTIDENGLVTASSNDSINEPKEDMQVYRYPPVTSEQLKAFYKENPYKFNGFPKDKNLY